MWLVYSPRANRLFCFCCWLFGKKSNDGAGKAWAYPCMGFSSFKKGTERVETHERSGAHGEAEKKYLTRECTISGEIAWVCLPALVAGGSVPLSVSLLVIF